jgi:hypothetical protein
MPKTKDVGLVTPKRIRELLDYDPETGALTWRVRKKGGRGFGGAAGGPGNSGQIRIGIDGHRFEAHRICWVHYYGRWPGGNVDHRDLVRTHNWITNLREATHSQNLCNRGKTKSNTSGFKGVFWSKQKNKWAVRIVLHKRSRHFGFFTEKGEAAERAATAYREMHGDFAHDGR